MSGKLTVIGLGPGSAAQLTPEASDALRAADMVFGYGPYLDRVPERAGQQRRGSDNRQTHRYLAPPWKIFSGDCKNGA